MHGNICMLKFRCRSAAEHRVEATRLVSALNGAHRVIFNQTFDDVTTDQWPFSLIHLLMHFLRCEGALPSDEEWCFGPVLHHVPVNVMLINRLIKHLPFNNLLHSKKKSLFVLPYLWQLVMCSMVIQYLLSIFVNQYLTVWVSIFRYHLIVRQSRMAKCVRICSYNLHRIRLYFY